MLSMDTRIHWFVTVVLLLACIFCAHRWRACEAARGGCNDRITELTKELGAANAVLDSLDVMIVPGSGFEMKDDFWYRQAVWARENQRMLLWPHEIRALQEWGLDDPVEQIRDDLVAHPELIPHEGVLGGQMHFPRDAITLLSRKLVYAEFSDGHIGGSCLLEYKVNPGGEIAWEVIRTYMD